MTLRIKPIFVLSVAIVLVAVVAAVALTTQEFAKPTTGKAPNSSGTSTEQHGEFKTFTSKELGISFDYAAGVERQRVLVREKDNRVYLSIDFKENFEAQEHKFVEVFSKDPQDSLSEAVTKQFLQGYSLDNCPVQPVQFSKNPSREYVQIATPFTPEKTYAEKMEAENLCPPLYTYNRRTGVVYFMADPSHPDKYVFFKIGQDQILGTLPSDRGGLTWDQTLKFTE